jgi:hypothetical protein
VRRRSARRGRWHAGLLANRDDDLKRLRRIEAIGEGGQTGDDKIHEASQAIARLVGS